MLPSVASFTPGGPGDQLASVVALRRLADRVEEDAVRRALDERMSWSEIADALGVTRQAVHKRYAKRMAG